MRAKYIAISWLSYLGLDNWKSVSLYKQWGKSLAKIIKINFFRTLKLTKDVQQYSKYILKEKRWTLIRTANLVAF